ncbi:hypothetical protein Pth03_74340 [Planotetraspora thailandica]|uniref:DUF4240 domain-containing protein n=1 Tax=Planotetraspora thailandica TaxID=487172 RepID=A0A8J3Y1C6_9ACTN|nr:DUF4240 domain-containing protein [Planotetraspora thailandica]GII59045.1 hypothetical protein Pth03_74340 [Planotetraspora thailandica]
METDAWWALIERARAVAGDRADDRDPPDDPLPQALTDLLAALDPAEIIAFDLLLTRVCDSAYTRPLWIAADLIEGGCGDDGFMDFRSGLILLGRETFTRAVADPDSLAGLPVVVRMSEDESGWIGCEDVSYAARSAYKLATGETDSFDAAVEAGVRAMDRPRRPSGEGWSMHDEDETRRRLPRLAALFLDED